MKLLPSACTNLLFPKSRKSVDEFREMAGFLKSCGIEGIEFYHDGDSRDKLGSILRDTGLDPVYITVIPSKEKKLHACDTDPERRSAAVTMLKACLDEAAGNGISQFMINSGGRMEDAERGLDALEASIRELLEYAQRKNYPLKLLMEPCDTHMDACQLIGSAETTAKFVRRCREAGLPLSLTMDSAHTVEEGDDFADALALTKAYCSHIHFASCVIDDRGSDYYGDRHVGFEYPGAHWTYGKLRNLWETVEEMYPGEEKLRVGIEVLCRTEDPFVYFDAIWHKLPFLH